MKINFTEFSLHHSLSPLNQPFSFHSILSSEERRERLVNERDIGTTTRFGGDKRDDDSERNSTPPPPPPPPITTIERR